MNPCAACGYAVHPQGPGSGLRCPVCGWVDDFEQLVHPDVFYGANAGLSLRQAQAQAARRGACDPVHGYARSPRWRPLRDGESPDPEPGAPSSPVCFMATPAPESYAPYWCRGR